VPRERIGDMSDRFRVLVGFFIISTVWGSTWLVIKIGLTRIPPFLSAGLRFAVATVILLIIVKARRVVVPFDADAKKLYVVLAVLSYIVPFGMVYWGQQYIPSGLSSILFAAYPFWVAVFSQLLLVNERLNVFKLVGIVFGFVGLLIIFAGDIHLSDASGLLGMTAVLLSTVLQGLALVLIKKYGRHVSPFAMNLVGMSWGAVGLVSLSLVTENYGGLVWDRTAIGSVLYLAVFGSVLGFVTYHWLLKRTEAVYLSLVSFINPIVAVILGAIVLDETLTPSVFTGASFVLSGILLANAPQLYRRLNEAL
jgi:drug/metabolite transporter (DMT)-like permease